MNNGNSKSRRRVGELRREYSAADLRRGVRGKYFRQFSSGTNLVRLDDDVHKAFKDERAVNDALRMLLRTARRAARVRTP